LTRSRATRRREAGPRAPHAGPRFYREVLESLEEYAVFTIDRAGVVTSWNRGGERIFGYTPREIVGKSAGSIFIPEDRAAGCPQTEMRDALEHGRALDERWHLRKDGRRFWGSGRMFPLRDSVHRHIGFTKIVQDLTEQKLASERLSAANGTIQRQAADLEKEVANRTARLTEINRELESFTYSASHDLRAPLRKIAAFSHMLLERSGASLTPESKDYLSRIQREIKKMNELIDDMLALARVTQTSPDIRDVDLSAMAAEIVDELRESHPRSGVETQIAGGLTARGDRDLCRIALHKLLDNAWKFTQPVRSPRIEFGAKTIGGERIYFVRDNGAGFDMDRSERMFEAFERLHNPEEFPGTGVGLAIARRAIERQRGRIWAEGRVGKGATLFFTLPAEAPR